MENDKWKIVHSFHFPFLTCHLSLFEDPETYHALPSRLRIP